MPRLVSLALMACLVAPAAACGETSVVPSPAPPDLYFPKRPPPVGRQVVQTAAMEGLIVLDRGCVWIKYFDTRYLVVWPSSYNARFVGGLVRVVDSNGAVVASQGARVVLGGGEVPVLDREDAQAAVGELTGTTIPQDCDVKFIWNASSVIPPD